MTERATAAVLTGDLIGSTRVAPGDVDRAIAILGRAAGDITGWMPGRLNPDTRFTRYRGDGWQMYLADPGLALRGLLYLHAALLRETDVRLATRGAIGIGRVGSLGTMSLADARGPAFEASGHALDDMARMRRFAVEGDGVSDLHRAVVDLLDERTGRWTRPQAEAMCHALAPAEPTGAEIASRLGISAQAVNYRLTGAGAAAIRRTLRAWEEGFRDA